MGCLNDRPEKTLESDGLRIIADTEGIRTEPFVRPTEEDMQKKPEKRKPARTATEYLGEQPDDVTRNPERRHDGQYIAQVYIPEFPGIFLCKYK